jgi:hypothetical protein
VEIFFLLEYTQIRQSGYKPFTSLPPTFYVENNIFTWYQCYQKFMEASQKSAMKLWLDGVVKMSDAAGYV